MTSRESPKRLLFRQFATIAKAAGHEYRLELLESLAQGERSVEGLADRIGISVANASQHLQQLRRAGLVTSRRKGKLVLYRSSSDAVLELTSALTRIGERHIAEVGQIVRDYFLCRDELEPVTRMQLLALMKKGHVQVLDVRPEDEFNLGHIDGAINIPSTKLKKKVSALDATKEIVAYCRGPYCVLSFEAVKLLREKGFSVRRLQDGLPEWQAAGLPISC